MARQINDTGLHLIEGFEGLFLRAYHGGADRPGLLTIGYGHTSEAGPPTVTAGMTITRQEADDILRADLTRCEAEVERLVKVPLNDDQFGAITSFDFNVGGTQFGNSTLLRKLNAGDYAAVPGALMSWVNSNGRRQDGLVDRRHKEGLLFMSALPIAKSANYIKPDDPDATARAVQHALNENGYGLIRNEDGSTAAGLLTEDGEFGALSCDAIMAAIKKAGHA